MKDIKPRHPYATYYTPPRFAEAQSRSREQSKKRSWKRASLVCLCLLVIVVGGIYTAVRSANSGTHAPVTKKASTAHVAKATTPKPAATASDPALAQMTASITGVIDQDSDIDFSVNLINLTNGQAEHYGTDDIFQAASTAKLIAAVDWLHQVEIGKQTMSQTVGPDTAANDIDQMITVSNDPDWKAIESTLGYTNLQNYAAGLGLTNYEAYNNSLPSGDIALILQKLWDGELLNKSDTQLLLSYMKEANYREYIVPAIPSGDTIYHKIGFYETYLNDAAIVTHANQAFVIVIFTNSDDDAYPWPARATMMQDITKAALQYYFNQSGGVPTGSATASDDDD